MEVQHLLRSRLSCGPGLRRARSRAAHALKNHRSDQIVNGITSGLPSEPMPEPVGQHHSQAETHGSPADSALRTAHAGVTSAVADGWVVGGSFFGSIMAGTLLGWLADRWLDTEPWLIVAGIVLGSVNGFYRLWMVGRVPTGKQPVAGR
ncbi:MAG: AtpZ/AtpI family protein [Acidimicrobiia bacterium]|nr:AtpZ/AtpI family protein [Acidimicrobiia bacterium]MYF82930.1 AtpZ/AtpI family protein [Acidimicrobiia bacterium]